MSANEWFRNRTWDKQIELRFEEKLRRARDKSQYLRIQASYVSETVPEVALELLRRYFDLGVHFDWAQALVDQAKALLTLGRTEEAIVSLTKALDRERKFPNLKTTAWSEYALLVADRKLESHYESVLHVLEEVESVSLWFPSQRFTWHAAKALIYQDQRRSNESQEEARVALETASADHSGFRYHPKVGLVTEADRGLKDKLRKILNHTDEI